MTDSTSPSDHLTRHAAEKINTQGIGVSSLVVPPLRLKVPVFRDVDDTTNTTKSSPSPSEEFSDDSKAMRSSGTEPASDVERTTASANLLMEKNEGTGQISKSSASVEHSALLQVDKQFAVKTNERTEGTSSQDVNLSIRSALQRVLVDSPASGVSSPGLPIDSSDSEVPDRPPLHKFKTQLLCSTTPDVGDDTSQEGSNLSQSSKKRVPRFGVHASHTEVNASQLHEYQWPMDGGDYYMLQEQVARFLGVLSFKRKYPDLQRRTVEKVERDSLQEKGIADEIQCNLGLTALRSDEVQEVMSTDFPSKFKEYSEVLAQREKQRMTDKNKEYSQSQRESVSKERLASQVRRSVKAAAEFNAHFNKERREERTCYFDLQTMEVHYPRGTFRAIPKEKTKASDYPVSLIAGQFGEFFKSYTKEELDLLPVKTALKPLPKVIESNANDSSDLSEDDQSSDESLGSLSDEESVLRRTEEQLQQTLFERNKPVCTVCHKHQNESDPRQFFIQCSTCQSNVHPNCQEMGADMTLVVRGYNWQCMECKTCFKCNKPTDEDQMMFCDRCDRGYHTYCVGLTQIPSGSWKCPLCAPVLSLDVKDGSTKKSRAPRKSGVRGARGPYGPRKRPEGSTPDAKPKSARGSRGPRSRGGRSQQQDVEKHGKKTTANELTERKETAQRNPKAAGARLRGGTSLKRKRAVGSEVESGAGSPAPGRKPRRRRLDLESPAPSTPASMPLSTPATPLSVCSSEPPEDKPAVVVCATDSGEAKEHVTSKSDDLSKDATVQSVTDSSTNEARSTN